jgi:ubiquinone/menaquinone biosynthesis C-methylase UbiE
MSPNAAHPRSSGTRDQVKEEFSTSGSEYDATRFERPRFRLLSECYARIFLKLLPEPAGVSAVLEIGAGTGRFTALVLERGFSVTATDINQGLLDTLRDKVSQMGAADRCRIEIQDMFDLKYADDTFDLVYSINVLPRLLTLGDQRAALLEIARVIKPGGRLLFNFRNKRSFYRFFFKKHTAAPDEISAILAAAGLSIVDQRGQMFSSVMLFNHLPIFLNRLIVKLDLALSHRFTSHAWDIFLLAEKAPASSAQEKSGSDV